MPEWEYRCDICKVSFRSLEQYKNHLNSYAEEPKHRARSLSLDVTESPSHQFHI